MQEQLNFLLNEVRSAWRFRWLALALAWGVSVAGWFYVAGMPDEYEASARVYVDTSSALRQILGTQIIEADVESQLNFVRQSMLGRTQLEKVALQSDIALRAETPEQLDGLIAALREGVQLTATGDPRRRTPDNLFSISFRDRDRDMALRVVQTLLNIFVEDTLGAKREGSESARRFLEQQVREYEVRLGEAEERLARFRRENADVLPGSQGGYFNRLQAESSALEDVRVQLALAESRRDRVREQLRTERSGGGSTRSADLDALPQSSLEARIQDSESRLEDLLLRYTDRHPDVVALRDTLARLGQQQEEQQAALAMAGDGDLIISSNPVIQALQINLNEIEVEMASLSVDARRRENRVAQLRSLIGEVPEVEAQLARLNRDYDVVNAQYQALLRSLETERLTREAAESDQVEFRVIDPPAAAAQPVAPNRPRMLALVLLAGLGGGGGLAFLLSQLRPVFANPRALGDVTGLPVLGAVSLNWRERHKLRRRMELLSFALGCAALVCVFVGVYYFETAAGGLRGLTA